MQMISLCFQGRLNLSCLLEWCTPSLKGCTSRGGCWNQIWDDLIECSFGIVEPLEQRPWSKLTLQAHKYGMRVVLLPTMSSPLDIGLVRHVKIRRGTLFWLSYRHHKTRKFYWETRLEMTHRHLAKNNAVDAQNYVPY